MASVTGEQFKSPDQLLKLKLADISSISNYSHLQGGSIALLAFTPINLPKRISNTDQNIKKSNFQEYQIAIVAFEIEDFDGDDRIQGYTERTMYGSAYALPNLLIQRVVLWSNRILLLLHHQQQRRRQKTRSFAFGSNEIANAAAAEAHCVASRDRSREGDEERDQMQSRHY